MLALEDTNAFVKAKKILKDHFGNALIVSDAYHKKINSWPKILPNDSQSLRKFADFLQHSNTAMNTIQYLNVLNDPDENKKIIKKLPSHVVVRWSRVANKWLGENELDEDCGVPQRRIQANKSGYPHFTEFCKFISKKARISCNPVTSLQALKADETALGWRVIGMVSPNACGCKEGLGVNRIVTHKVQYHPRKICHFALKTRTKEILNPLQAPVVQRADNSYPADKSLFSG